LFLRDARFDTELARSMRRRDPAYPTGTGQDRGSRLVTIRSSSVVGRSANLSVNVKG
jgi:hypothetical protein